MRKVISLGVGVQSTYIVLASTEEYAIEPIYSDWKDAYILFADTGSEKQDTLEYYHRILEPIMKRNNRRYKIVRSEHYPLYDYYYRNTIIPMRMYRLCTDKFKITPLNREIKSYFENVNFKNPVKVALGITKDEVHRMRPNKRKYIINEFPIIDKTREEIIKQYSEWGLPVPVKSGCWLCPFMNIEDMKQLSSSQWEQLETLENNARAYDQHPEKRELYLLREKPISYWRDRITREKSLKTYELDMFFTQDECSGSCFL